MTLLHPHAGRRKRSYKQAVSELDEEQQLEDEELQPPRSKTPSPPCPASKVSVRLPSLCPLPRPRALTLVPLQVVRPLRTFLHTVQRNQTLMTPTSTPHSSVKSFMKRNTPLRVDPKVRAAWLKAAACPQAAGSSGGLGQGGVTWHWSRTSLSFCGPGLPRHLGTVLTPWALHCSLEARPGLGSGTGKWQNWPGWPPPWPSIPRHRPHSLPAA